MPRFSKSSKARLAECALPLQNLFNRVIQSYDCGVETGHRGEAAQNLAVRTGSSDTPYPLSKHNSKPANAADVYPYVNGHRSDDPRVCREFAGFVLGIAETMKIRIRWGGDWDGDHDPSDQRLNDLVHFELLQ